MSEWQPARLVNAHKSHIPYPEVLDAEKRVVQARETQLPDELLPKCDGALYFEVEEIPNRIFCEHEILTD